MECKQCIHNKVCPHLKDTDAKKCKQYVDKDEYINVVKCKDCGTMQLNKDCYAEYDLKTKEVKFQCQKCYEKEEKPKGYPVPLKEGKK